MTQKIRVFMLVEALTFILASLVHSGLIVSGYFDPAARIAEGVIAAVLMTALILSLLRPTWIRGLGLVAQGFALLGTLVGLFTIAIGIGPRTVPDLVYHVAIVVILVWGLVVTARAGTSAIR